jgi:beta-barrel assembly-enhancing protease
MQSYTGIYHFEGDVELPATLLFLKEHLSIGYTHIDGLHKKEIWKYKALQHRYVHGNATIITHPDFPKRSVHIPEKNITTIINALQTKDARPWISKTITGFRVKLLLVLLGFLGLLALLYTIFVPFLSEQLAKRLPKKYEISLGNAMFKAMVQTNKLDTEKTVLVNEYFRKLAIKTDYPIYISVLKDPTVNAFAIMGGHIVVYTGLLERMTHHEELAALLAHEFPHIEHKHTTRSIFRSLSSKVFLSLLLGKMGNLTTIVLNNTDQFTGLQYSRTLEKEADQNGLVLLTQQKLNAEGFVYLFQHLQAAGTNSIPEFLSSHPDTEKRIQYIKENPIFSTGEKSNTNVELEVLFKAIKGIKEDFSF